MTGLRTFLAVAFIPLLILLIKRTPTQGRVIDIMMIGFVAWGAFAFSQTSPDQAVENTGAMALELLGGYLIARVFICNPQDFLALILAIFMLILLTLPLAVWEAATGQPPLIAAIRAIPGLTSVAIVDIEPRLGLERVQAIFAHPIHYGLFASTGLTLMFVGTRGYLGTPTRLFGLTIAVVASFLALSSGAFLSVLLQLALIGWALVFGARRTSWIALICLCAVAYLLIDLASNRSPVRVFFSYATFSAHNAYWRGIIFEWGMVNLWQSPIFGIGLNDWARPEFMRSGSMDNFWLVIAVRYGVPGFLLLAAAYLSGLFRVAFAPVPPEWRSIRQAWVICFVGLTFTLCTVHIWTSVFSYVFFLFGAGIWMISPANSEAPKHPLRPQLKFTRFTPVAA